MVVSNFSVVCGLISFGLNSCVHVFLQCEVVVAHIVLDLRNNINCSGRTS